MAKRDESGRDAERSADRGAEGDAPKAASMANDVVSDVIESVCSSLLPALLGSMDELVPTGGIGATCGTKFRCGTFKCTKDVACTSSKFHCTSFTIVELGPGESGERA